MVEIDFYELLSRASSLSSSSMRKRRKSSLLIKAVESFSKKHHISEIVDESTYGFHKCERLTHRSLTATNITEHVCKTYGIWIFIRKPLMFFNLNECHILSIVLVSMRQVSQFHHLRSTCI